MSHSERPHQHQGDGLTLRLQLSESNSGGRWAQPGSRDQYSHIPSLMPWQVELGMSSVALELSSRIFAKDQIVLISLNLFSQTLPEGLSRNPSLYNIHMMELLLPGPHL